MRKLNAERIARDSIAISESRSNRASSCNSLRHGAPHVAAISGLFQYGRSIGERTFPVIDLPLSFVFADAVGPLHFTGENIASAFDDVELIVCQPAPFLFHFAAEL